MNFVPGDMVFVLDYNDNHPHKPMIVMDSYTSPMFGLRYVSIIDPRTGWPVANGCVQATVVVPKGNSVEKNAAMRALGAQLVEHGEDFQAARDRNETDRMKTVIDLHKARLDLEQTRTAARARNRMAQD